MPGFKPARVVAATILAAAIVYAAPSLADQNDDAAGRITSIGTATIQEHRVSPAPSAIAGAAVLLGMIITVSRARRRPHGLGPLGLHHDRAEPRDSYTL